MYIYIYVYIHIAGISIYILKWRCSHDMKGKIEYMCVGAKRLTLYTRSFSATWQRDFDCWVDYYLIMEPFVPKLLNCSLQRPLGPPLLLIRRSQATRQKAYCCHRHVN